jgi:hypothetical protein
VGSLSGFYLAALHWVLPIQEIDQIVAPFAGHGDSKEAIDQYRRIRGHVIDGPPSIALLLFGLVPLLSHLEPMHKSYSIALLQPVVLLVCELRFRRRSWRLRAN